MNSSHDELIATMKECTACDLYTGRKTVVVGKYGKKEGICFIGEAPGYHEDQQGEPFVGKSGKLLDEMLDYIGLQRGEEASILNINKCRPPNNRKPTEQEMNTCGKLWLQPQLKYLQPSLMVALGSTALNYFFPTKKISSTQNKILSTDLNIPLTAIYHPAYVLRGGYSRERYKEGFNEVLDLYKQIKEGKTPSSSDKSHQERLDSFFK